MSSSHHQTSLSPWFDIGSHDVELTYLAEAARSQGDVASSTAKLLTQTLLGKHFRIDSLLPEFYKDSLTDLT